MAWVTVDGSRLGLVESWAARLSFWIGLRMLFLDRVTTLGWGGGMGVGFSGGGE